jgi:4-amino-4-deoxy-L-arabinose transferase-like glycosyltransferase
MAAPFWRPVLGSAALAFAVRAVLFVAASQAHPESYMSPDARGYDALARTVLHDGRFAAGPGDPAQTRRTPGFPLLVASVYAVAGEDPRAAVWAGIVLSGLTVALVAWLAHGLWGVRAAWTAGLLVALDAPSATASRRLLTEAPFTVLLLGGVAAAIGLLGTGEPRARRGLAMGALFAAAALTRPIGLLLVIPVSLWLIVCGRRLGWSRRATASLLAASLLPWILMVGGWQARNRMAVGAFVPSDGPAKFLYRSRGADIVAQRDGMSFAAARIQLTRRIEEEAQRTGRPVDRLYAGAALDLIARHPILFLKTQVRWLPELLLGTGAAAVDQALDLDRTAGRRVLAGLVAVGAAFQLLLLYAGAGRGVWVIRNESPARRLAGALLFGLVLYFVVLSTGPQTYSRFRVPFTPLLALLAARGLDRAGQAAVSAPSSSQWARSRRVR